MRYVYFFSGFNKEENFRILIAAASEDEAFDFAEKYRKDAGIKGKFCIEEVPGYIEDIRFDCDYLITEYLEDIISTSEAAAAQGFFLKRCLENSQRTGLCLNIMRAQKNSSTIIS